ncbi:uncharacterized protein LOC132031304 isoform X2 [Lycium ferocissimum]|uniref:uncharacterized protein LOC132031304 isoform X2 n=1 Tax=Lycium ferocissimum TaxID=112874 RepID=UPI002815A111|nr:uncharacterized protein LOC132031304 isoform X2 [Lycium ferocissimum]
MANVTALHNQKLNNLVVLVPKWIEKALVPIRLSIVKLEARVDSLEAKNRNNDIADFRTELSKVKIDIRLLKPDLRIFDIPVPPPVNVTDDTTQLVKECRGASDSETDEEIENTDEPAKGKKVVDEVIEVAGVAEMPEKA